MSKRDPGASISIGQTLPVGVPLRRGRVPSAGSHERELTRIFSLMDNPGDYYLLAYQAASDRGAHWAERDDDIDGIIVHVRVVAAGTTALAVADDYAVRSRASVHAVADADTVVEMLPDGYVAVHMPGNDERSLALEVVLAGDDADALESALEQAARWAAERVDRHAIAVRQVTADQWLAGTSGLVGADELAASDRTDFPWEHFLDMISSARRRRRRGGGLWRTRHRDGLVFSGDRTEDDGRTEARFELDVDDDANGLTGAEFWTWTGPGGGCTNGLSTVTAVRTG